MRQSDNRYNPTKREQPYPEAKRYEYNGNEWVKLPSGHLYLILHERWWRVPDAIAEKFGG